MLMLNNKLCLTSVVEFLHRGRVDRGTGGGKGVVVVDSSKRKVIYWSSKLQTEIALSTAEAEYIALSSSLREVIPLMTVMDELNKVFPLLMEAPQFYCKVWEDNQSCIAMATSQKFTPRTKHIALKYHHFKGHVKSG